MKENPGKIIRKIYHSMFFPKYKTMDRLISVQQLVAEKVIDEDEFDKLRYVAGVDQSFVKNKVISGIVIIDSESMEVIEKQHSISPLDFPYIPTFLSFREG